MDKIVEIFFEVVLSGLIGSLGALLRKRLGCKKKMSDAPVKESPDISSERRDE